VPVDVLTEIEIARPRSEVAAYAADPENATDWYQNIESAEWLTPKPLDVGSRAVFVAKFLGRRLEYTYEVVEFVPDERLLMRGGDFPMETTYTWEDAPGQRTRMTLRNRGEPAGPSKLIAFGIRRQNRKDLERLEEILEARQPGWTSAL
jgi:uncharacterized membrane protein